VPAQLDDGVVDTGLVGPPEQRGDVGLGVPLDRGALGTDLELDRAEDRGAPPEGGSDVVEQVAGGGLAGAAEDGEGAPDVVRAGRGAHVRESTRSS
jgi:hypothetical protein